MVRGSKLDYLVIFKNKMLNTVCKFKFIQKGILSINLENV